MWYLFIITLLIACIYIFDYKGKEKGRFKMYVLCWLIFVLTAGLRYRLGTDTITYDFEYKTLPALDELFSYDYSLTRYGKGYLFLNAIARSISDQFFVMQIIQSLFVNTLIFYFFYKYTNRIFTAVLLYFILAYFNFNFEVLREGCSVAVFLCGFKYFLNKQWAKYYFMCLIAFFFHPSALFACIFPIMLTSPFKYLFTINKYFFISAFVALVISAYLSIKFFDIINALSFINAMNTGESYEGGDLAGMTTRPSSIIFHLVCYCMFPLISAFILNNYKKNTALEHQKLHTINIFQSFTCLYIYVAIAGLFVGLIFRFTNYLIPIVIVMVSNSLFIVFKESKRKFRLSFGCWSLILLPYILVSLYPLINQDKKSGVIKLMRYYPYENVIDPETNVEREIIFRYYNK